MSSNPHDVAGVTWINDVEETESRHGKLSGVSLFSLTKPEPWGGKAVCETRGMPGGLEAMEVAWHGCGCGCDRSPPRQSAHFVGGACRWASPARCACAVHVNAPAQPSGAGHLKPGWGGHTIA